MQRVGELQEKLNLRWPTEDQDQTVQHILHSQSLHLEMEPFDKEQCYKDSNSKGDKLSDHPLLIANLSFR